MATETERSVRRELAPLYRLAHRFGWTDLTSTYISARLPDDPGHYLMNSYDLLFEEITASKLSKVSFDGEMKSPGRLLNTAGHLIHSAVLNARPEVNFVLHSHTWAGIPVSAHPDGLLPLPQHAGVVLGTLAVHDCFDVTAAADECALLVRDLGPSYAMLLRNHGLLCVGRTPGEAFVYHYYLEMACRIQVDILAMTDRPVVLAGDALAPILDWGHPDNGPLGSYQWPPLLRMLERTCPDYAD